MKLDGKVAIVTGGAKGIGAATAEAFLRAGASVSILDIEPDGRAHPAEWHDRVLYSQADVARAADVAAAIRATAERFGRIDYLINNAGIQHYASVTATSEEEWDHVIGVNLKGAFLCARQVIPLMQQRGAGVIINVASVQSFVSQRHVAAYTTSKSALLGLTRSIAVDYAPEIRCVAVCPGSVDTPMFRDALSLSPDPEAVLQECVAMHPLRRIAAPEEVASLILYLCTDAAAFITGQYIRIDGGSGIGIGGSKRDA
jgi:NAD(P)-dependent dehydrogenase (short-subunit alcohol dehydrogenase family)